jgi:hypothetical protein
MPTRPAKTKHDDAGLPNDPAAVDAYIRSLDHPLKAELEALRRLILGVHPDIGEGIKWNAPSFHLHDYFATTGLRANDHVQLVLHTGAKAKTLPEPLKIDDHAKLLTWHAPDRASLKLASMADITSKAESLKLIVDQWTKFMRKLHAE